MPDLDLRVTPICGCRKSGGVWKMDIESIDILDAIANWYVDICAYGEQQNLEFRVDTLDNPGWHLVADGGSDQTANRKEIIVDTNKSKDDWIYIKTNKHIFDRGGGPAYLENILVAFYLWAIGAYKGEVEYGSAGYSSRSDVINDIQKWYMRNCDGDWEHSYGVIIEIVRCFGWKVEFSLCGTELDKMPFDDINISRGQDDWIKCEKFESKLICTGGPKNIAELLSSFIDWAKVNGGI